MSKLSSMQRRIADLENQIKRLKPQPAQGTRTSVTTRGTTRSAAAGSKTTTQDTAPRWA